MSAASPDPAKALAAAMSAAAAEIDHALDALIPPPEGDEARLFEAMRYASMGGGKRLRGFLVLEGAAQFSVSREAALRVAAAIEMLHAYSLVHDDLPCMDDDDLRRGKPTVHRAFDEATAVLAGDALQTQAFLVLSEPDTHPDPAVRAELCRTLARAAGARGMCGGQMLDMLAEEAGRPLEEAEIGRLQLLKTGKLIEFSAEAGAILGLMPPPQPRKPASAPARMPMQARPLWSGFWDLNAPGCKRNGLPPRRKIIWMLLGKQRRICARWPITQSRGEAK
jgi:farnesyl diphosphate synthase